MLAFYTICELVADLKRLKAFLQNRHVQSLGPPPGDDATEENGRHQGLLFSHLMDRIVANVVDDERVAFNQQLIEDGALEGNNVGNEVPDSPLVALCKNEGLYLLSSNFQIIQLKLLLARGATVSVKDKDGRTPLHHAVASLNQPEEIRIQFIKLLVEYKADVNARDNKGLTPLILAAMTHPICQVYATMEALLDLHADVNAQDDAGRTTLQAVFGRYMEGSSPDVLEQQKLDDLVCLLVRRGANIRVANQRGWTPLHMACSLGLPLAVALMVQHHPADFAANSDHNGDTPLHLGLRRPWYSSGSDVLWFVRLLVHDDSSNATVNQQNNSGSTSLREAVARDYGDEVNTQVVQFLIDHHADVFDADHKNGRTLLHEVAATGRIDVARLLLNFLPNVNVVDNEGNTPLHLAVRWQVTACPSRLEMVQFLLDQTNANVNARNNFGDTPLHILLADHFYAQRGLEMLQLLVSRGADALAMNQKGTIPLIYAMKTNKWSWVRVLCDNFKNTKTTTVVMDLGTAKDEDGNTPLHLAAQPSNYDLELFKFFLQHQANNVDARNNVGDTPLRYYVCCTLCDGNFKDFNFEKARLLVSRGAHPLAANNAGVAPLPWVMRNGTWELVRILISHNVNVRDDSGNTPLHVATANYTNGLSLATVQFLVNHKDIEVNARNDMGDTPLDIICSFRNITVHREEQRSEFVELLVGRGADPLATNKNGERPLFDLMNKRKWPSVHKLIRAWRVSAGVDVNIKDKFGNTPLHLALMALDNVEMVQFFVDHQADVNAKNNHDNTPLHYLCFSSPLWSSRVNDLEKARLLLQRGAHPFAVNKECTTPLHSAIKNHKWAVARLLAVHDVNCRDYCGDTPLHLATRLPTKVNFELLQFLTDHHADVNARNAFGDTPIINLHHRGHQDDLEIIQLLANRGARVCDFNKDHNTPLRRAIRDHKWKLIGKLLEEEEDHFDEGQGFVDQFLSIMVKRGDAEFASFLVERGANLNAPDFHGMSPLVTACEMGTVDTIYRLIRLSPHHFRPQLRHP